MGQCCSGSISNHSGVEIEQYTTSSIYETPLHKSARLGDLKAVKRLLESSGEDVNSLNGANQTALIEACRMGKEDIAVYLIETYDSLNPLLVDDSNRQALSYAAGNGMKEVCLKLLSFEGADINGNIEDGASVNSTPLWHAATEGHEDVVKFLLRQEGINVNAFDVNHWTSLFQATRHGHIKVVELLLEAGADVFLAGLPDLENPLHIAAVNGTRNQQQIATLLIEYGREDLINTKTRLGYTSIIVATIKGHTNLAKLLVDGGGDVNIRLPPGETAGLSALHLACIKGYHDIARLLCEAGAAIGIADEDGITPMAYAEQKAHLACMEVLNSFTGNRF